ncbi:MAG: ATP-binding cassette domain-containing protein [Clostridia bacterium]|nr:ATP-binding cassette domain-containing protein [Clostridia bacterium]
MHDSDNILEVRGLKKYFPITAGFFKKTVGYVRAVDDIDIYVKEGETLALVGESGCGKTTLGRSILRAIQPTAGEVLFRRRDGEVVDLTKIGDEKMRDTRRDMQMVFQDPYASLNPRMTVLNIISEPLICHKLMKGKAMQDYVRELMETVGLNPKHLERYPHAFSGGQRQRIGIARALATKPRFIVCDEAVSALDVSVQAQILNLLMDLQSQMNLSYVFISHDLGVVRHISDRVGVMYVGHMVEMSETTDLFDKPMHPYTEALLSAKPVADPRNKSKRIMLEGEVANPAHLPSGCPFHPRCRYCQEVCKKEVPEWRELKPGHFVACHRAHELDLDKSSEKKKS